MVKASILPILQHSPIYASTRKLQKYKREHNDLHIAMQYQNATRNFWPRAYQRQSVQKADKTFIKMSNMKDERNYS